MEVCPSADSSSRVFLCFGFPPHPQLKSPMVDYSVLVALSRDRTILLLLAIAGGFWLGLGVGTVLQNFGIVSDNYTADIGQTSIAHYECRSIANVV